MLLSSYDWRATMPQCDNGPGKGLRGYFLSPSIATSKKSGPVCVPITGLVLER